MVFIAYDDLMAKFASVLEREGVERERARLCAGVLADNTRDGVVSHGAGRFAWLVARIRNGAIDIAARPERIGGFGAFEQWDGHRGLGVLNALDMIRRATELATEHGAGVAAIRNTTHWMRGGTYGHWAAERGFPCICWTNTIANMPAWGGSAVTLGNNPVVFAIPGEERHVVLDMALSQYSFGKLETLVATGDKLPMPGGYDKDGALTDDPGKLLESQRVFPIGMWKGSGMALVLDLFAAILSDGTSTVHMPEEGPKVSQVFVAFHPGRTEEERRRRRRALEDVLDAFKAELAKSGESAAWPGEGTLRRRRESEAEGIAIPEGIWDEVMKV